VESGTGLDGGGERFPSISVITATYNAAGHLPQLIASLIAQTDHNFAWIIADGGSTDGTLELIEEASAVLSISVDSRPDCGIYDALNRAIEVCDTEFYIVIGADDTFEPAAIENYRRAAVGSDADLITASIKADGEIKAWPRRWEWLYGQFAHVSGHAVGLMIRTNLHAAFGNYRQDLRIAADQKFILDCVHGGAILTRANFVAGNFTTSGTSGNNVLASLLEGFAVRLSVGHRLTHQLLVLCGRLLRHRKRITDQHR
jgi:glycosyltransferase involved in cell wall biosynthesis